jgi:aminoglycoside phosphotransferase (APT) family kinase protein
MSPVRGPSAGLVVAAPQDSELREALLPLLRESGVGAPGEIRRSPYEYRTSFPLERLDLRLADGASLSLLFKQLDWDALGDEARLAKPRFLHDPAREPAVYGSVLPAAPPGPPRYYGAEIDPGRGRHWLFIERVEGRELFQVGDRALWETAAVWLAEMHRRLAGELDRHRASGRLLEHDGAYYRGWAERARRFAHAPGQPRDRAQSVDALTVRYEAAIDELLAMPKTVIHGEFYASNVLVAGEGASPRVCPVDWELAAAAPGLTDLAALVSGGWSEDDREAIAAAYRAAAGPGSAPQRQLDLARLQLAIQWLGWAEPGWTPPLGQRHDWLGEAEALTERLGL